MKIKSGFVLRKVADSYVAVPIGNMTAKIRGLISLNETGAEIWKIITNCDKSEKEITDELCGIFRGDREAIEQGTAKFIEELRKKDLLEE